MELMDLNRIHKSWHAIPNVLALPWFRLNNWLFQCWFAPLGAGQGWTKKTLFTLRLGHDWTRRPLLRSTNLYSHGVSNFKKQFIVEKVIYTADKSSAVLHKISFFCCPPKFIRKQVKLFLAWLWRFSTVPMSLKGAQFWRGSSYIKVVDRF